MNKMKQLLKRRLVASLLSLMMPLSLLAQNIQVQGIVKDQTGETVIGATVMQKGTSNGTITDYDGKFTLNVPSKAILVFSYIGFATQEVAVNGRTNLLVTLKDDQQVLNEVVVIGYGTMDKKELTSAISHISEKDFLTVSSMDPSMMIQGKVAGVSITNTGSGDPNNQASIQIRGVSSRSAGLGPLIVVDGVPGGNLTNINPNDIASFDILKDGAASAIYGTRGSNGVIVVTTKKGQSKQFHISYDGNIGIESVSDNINMLYASSYVATAQALGKDYVDGGYNTNFRDVLTRTGFVQNHHIAFSGGSDTQNYRASLALMQENTVIKNNGYKNFVAKIDVKQKAFDDLLTIDLGVTGSTQKNNEIDDIQKLFYSAAAQNPTYPAAMNASGGWDRNTNASQISNPLATLYRENKDKIMNFNTHMKFTFQLTPSLTATLFGSYSYTSDENDNFKPTWVWAQGQASRYESKREDWL